MSLMLREVRLAFQRAPLLSILSIVTIAFSLFVVGLFGLAAINLQRALGNLAERVEIVAYVQAGTPAAAVPLALEDIVSFPEVDSARYITEAEALERAQRELPEFRQVFRDSDVNPLPASIEVWLVPGSRDTESLEATAERLRAFSFIDDVRFGRDWVEKLDSLRGIAAVVGLVIGTAFAAVAIIIIGTTIRMAVLQRGREIAIMRLVGATDGFIRRPFLVEGLIKGALGGGSAVLLCLSAYLVIDRMLLETSFFTAWQAAALVAFGMLIGFFGSLTSLRRHLRQL